MHLNSSKKLNVFIILLSCLIHGQNNTTLLVRSTTGVSGSSSNISSNNNNYVIQQSFGQTSSIGSFNTSNYEIRQGFIQPNLLSKIIDKNIPVNLNIDVFPNPFKETITLNFTEVQKGEIVVSIYDMLGRLVNENTYNAEKTIILQLSNLAKANFILKVRSDNNQFVKKILKK